MGGFWERPGTFFRVGPAAIAFALKWGDAKGRLDTWFNHPRYTLLNAQLDAAPIPTPALGGLLESIAGGATPSRSNDSLYADDDGVRFFRILNVDDGEIVDQDLKYVTTDVHNGLLERSQLAAGDVLMTITGRVGSAATVRQEHLPANINQHIARLRVDTERCRPEFLSEWLNCPAGLELSNRYASGGTRAALDYGAIRNLRVPLPSLAMQDALVDAMYAARVERQAKLAQADALLAGIDDFLLDALGITPPAEDSRRVFAVNITQLSGQERLNSDYYHPERVQALQQLDRAADSMRVAPLAEVAAFEREQLKTPGDNYLSLAHVESNTGELADVAGTASGNCFTYRADDVLFARLRPYLNKVHCAEMDGCCSTEFHVLRVKDPAALLPEYLAAILRSRLVLAQTVHMMTGNTHPRLTNDDVANLTIPIPSRSVQESIAGGIAQRRDAARQLRGEAEASWVAVKRWFEETLLG